jgi:hypothetical protein
LTKSRSRFALLALAASALAVPVLLGTGSAGAETLVPAYSTITIDEAKPYKPRFVAPKTVVQGEQLRIVNATSAKKMGPHTLSLVEASTLPKTPNARKHCFTPSHICMAIARWHGVKGNGPPTINPAEAGLEGWDTEGSLSEKGDSWFTGSKKGASFEQVVSAEAGKTLHFICAIHPWMQGSVKVVAPPVPPVPTGS